MSKTLDLINEYSRFVATFFEVISTSASHIYHSALPLSPGTSTIHELYKPYARPLARIVQGFPISWEPIVATVRHPGQFSKAVWSPCSRYLAVSCSRPATIEILDAVTLGRIHTFEPHENTGWLSFSSDSRSLTQFSGDLTTWDLQTGGRINTIPSTSHTTTLRCFSSTYSIDGTMVAAAYLDPHNTAATSVSIYNPLSGTRTYFHHAPEGRIVGSIWTHDECLRFVTVKPGSIIVWEAGFASIHTLAKVESLPAPNNSYSETTLYLPTLSRLAFRHENGVLIWDARDSKLLLEISGIHHTVELSFSSDGCFFTCQATYQETHIWKDSPDGYVLHRKLVSSIKRNLGNLFVIERIKPLLSPDGGSIITSRPFETQLWRVTNSITSLSTIPTQPTKRTKFLLEFSPDRSLAVTARLWDNVAIVIDLKSGNPLLIIDTGVEVCSLRLTGNAIIVVGGERVTTWNLPAGDHGLNARANTDDSVRIVTFNHPTPLSRRLQSTAISAGFDYIVVTWWGEGKEGLDIYEMSTGNHLVGTTTGLGHMAWISPDGCELWTQSGFADRDSGWKIIRDGRSDIIGLEPLPSNTRPFAGYSWRSPDGHEVSEDGWILNSRGRRHMWLPHYWRQFKPDQAWGGRFLGLLGHELPEPIIIELDE